MITWLALAAALAAAAPPPADTVDAVEVVTRAPVAGDLQKGVVNYRPEFFVKVRPSTAMDMVAWLPGFAFEDTRDMRGLEGSTGNVLIDGKPPTSKTDTLQSVLRRIPSSQVERVDLIVGGAPGIDMHGRTVIANVILKVSATKRRVIDVHAYVDLHGRVSPEVTVSTSEKHDGKVVEASLQVSRNIAIFPTYGYGSWVRRDGAGAVMFAADSRFNVGGPFVLGSGSYELPFAGGRLRLNGSAVYLHAFQDEVDELTSEAGLYRFQLRESYRKGELGARYERTVGRFTLETQALERVIRHRVNYDTRRPPAPSDFTAAANETESVARALLRFKPTDKFTLEGFVEGALNGIDTLSSVTSAGMPQALPASDVAIRERRGEAGVTLNWKPNARFSLDAALKTETSTLTASHDVDLTRRFTYPKPRLAITWAVDKRTQLRLRAEHEVGQLSYGYFVTIDEFNSGQVRVGNPDLRPQRAWTAEAVLERQFWTGGALVLTARRKALRDVIDVAPLFAASGPVGVFANIGNGRETDLIASLTLPLKPFGLRDAMLKATVTSSRARVPDPVTGRERQLSGQSALLGELHFTQDFPQWKLNWGVDAFYRGASTLYRPFGDEALGGWPHVNVFIEYRPKPALNLRLEVQNLPGTHTPLLVSNYAGLRGASPLNYVDDKRLSVGPLVFVRARRTFE